MAFQLSNAAASGFGVLSTSNNAQTQTGPDLEDIETEGLGFSALAGEVKIQLAPSWPTDALPPPTASLLSVASKKGLIAAAGPNSIIVAGTESVRQAFQGPGSANDKIRSFTPQLTLDIGTRVSQVAFSAGEEHLAISAENGGGLAVYDVQGLGQGQTAAIFELNTNGASLRSLVPNPTEERSEFFAVITNNGDLMMANLKARSLLNGAQGPILKNGVSCVTWSTKGKALVGGLGNGTCYQLSYEGKAMAEIPRPPAIEGEYHVASISWIENNLFLIGYTPTSLNDPMIPATEFFVVTREKNEGPFLFQRLPEVCSPFGLPRSPPHFFMQRLKDFPPNIQDIILVASTASIDIGLFSRAKAPLASDAPTGVFTTTIMANDSRRAALPMSEGEGEDMGDTSPIGTAIDLSVKEKVPRPLPGEEMDTSPGPVPALMVLNNEGVLAAWWIIYAESIRDGTTFPGLVSQLSQTPNRSQPSLQSIQSGNASSQSAVAFSQPALGGASTLDFGITDTAKPASSLFGGSNAQAPTTSAAFGTPPAPETSPWSNAQSGTPSFGKPSFGTASTPSFGVGVGFGNRVSAWSGATSGAPQTGGSVSDQSGSLGNGGASSNTGIFGSGLSGAPVQGGFASFATAPGSGFMSSMSKAGEGSSFAKPGANGSFGSNMDTDSPIGGTPQKKDSTTNMLSMSGFTLGSTFTKDDSDPPDLPRPAKGTQDSMFGAFSSALGEATKSVPQIESKETNMYENESDMAGSESSDEQLDNSQSRTPVAKPAQPRGTTAETSTPKIGGLVGTQSHAIDTPAAVQKSTPAPSIFGGTFPPSTTTPAETPQKQQDSSPLTAQTPPSPPIKPDPEDDDTQGVSKSIPEAPLPPESTSKASYVPGDSSNSSKSSAEDALPPPDWNPSKTKLNNVENLSKAPTRSSTDNNEAPLPPDFLPLKSKSKVVDETSDEEPALPEDDEDDGLDDEGSGVDVAQEVSPTTDPSQTPKITPGSSFGPSFGSSPVSNVFSKAQPRQSVKTLFGEVSSQNVPVLPPPDKSQQSPRSPSPIRLAPPGDGLRPENARSLSAPSRPPVAQQRGGRSSVALKPSAIGIAQDQLLKSERESLAARRAKQQAEEEQDLSDREDELVREELDTEVEPTKTLDDFLAHQDYVGSVTKPGIPGQIEKVYRDINSMVDTLGLNARSLEGFVRGHLTMAQDGGRSIEDLDKSDWCLVETEELENLEEQLHDRLDQGRIQEVQEKLSACHDIRKELSKFRAKRNEIKKTLDAADDEDKADTAKYAPLTVSQATLQHDLRKAYAKVQKLITEVEGSITLLRARLASQDVNGKNSALKKPTVEAVTNTIRKMTSMVERKSSDIDLLEAQMRKMRFGSVNQNSSREGSPFAASSSSVNKLGSSMLCGSTMSATDSPRSSLRQSTSPSPGKSRSGLTTEEVEAFRLKTQRRKEVNKIMREAFAKAKPRIQALE